MVGLRIPNAPINSSIRRFVNSSMRAFQNVQIALADVLSALFISSPIDP
jgi:hypothetical protein